MKRKVVHSESEFVQYLVKNARLCKFGTEEMEDLIGVEFAFKDGTFISDEDQLPEGTDVIAWSSQPCDYSKYRITQPKRFPKTYPAMALVCFENDYDRGGFCEIRMVLFVEQVEFRRARKRPRMPLPGV